MVEEVEHPPRPVVVDQQPSGQVGEHRVGAGAVDMAHERGVEPDPAEQVQLPFDPLRGRAVEVHADAREDAFGDRAPAGAGHHVDGGLRRALRDEPLWAVDQSQRQLRVPRRRDLGPAVLQVVAGIDLVGEQRQQRPGAHPAGRRDRDPAVQPAAVAGERRPGTGADEADVGTLAGRETQRVARAAAQLRDGGGDRVGQPLGGDDVGGSVVLHPGGQRTAPGQRPRQPAVRLVQLVRLAATRDDPEQVADLLEVADVVAGEQPGPAPQRDQQRLQVPATAGREFRGRDLRTQPPGRDDQGRRVLERLRGHPPGDRRVRRRPVQHPRLQPVQPRRELRRRVQQVHPRSVGGPEPNDREGCR